MVDMYLDQELVEKILDGNEQAFTLLVKKHERLVYYLVYRVIGEVEQTKDVCQEVFVQVYLKLEKFNFKSKLSTWIATIAYRHALNHVKRDRKKAFDEELNSEKDYDEYVSESPELILEQSELKDQIHNLIDLLPHQYKTVLTLYHLNEFNYKEIYDITGWPEGTVKNYLFRARKMLKDMISSKVKKQIY